MEKPSPATLWLLGGFAALLILILVLVGRNSGDQDRLGDDATLSLPDEAQDASSCDGRPILAGLKSALFARAVAMRGKDEDAYRDIAGAAVVRMDNAALEEETAGGFACTATVAIDLPPGIIASGGRRNLMGNVDYSVEGDGGTVSLRNNPSLASELASLARSSGGITTSLDQPPPDVPTLPDEDPSSEPPGSPVPAPSPTAQPSYDCAKARTRGEQAVCGDPNLASLDRQMAAQYSRAMASASPDRQAILRQSRDRFLGFRDRCPDSQCIANAYQGRMREISDIMAGRWQPPR